MPFLLTAALAASWFSFWTSDATSPRPVSLHPDTRCVHGGVQRTTLFGAGKQHFPDGSFGALTPSPLFVAFHATGPVSVWVRGDHSPVRLRVDGDVAKTTETGAAGCTRLDAALHGPHRVGVELAVGERIVGVKGDVSIDRPPPGAPRAVFLGDSYTDGYGGTTSPGYAYRAGWAKGWDVRIDALGGTGFLNRAGKRTFAERIPEVLRQHPDVVVVAGGINDYGSFPNDQIAVAAQDIFRRLARSGAQVIALSPWTTPRLRGPGYADLVLRVGAAARKMHVRYIDTSDWLTPSLMSPDGIHPNERGYRTIAAKLALRL